MNFQFHPILTILISSCPGFILVLAPVVWTCDFPASSNPHFGPMWKRLFRFPKDKSKDQLAQSIAKEILEPSVWLQFFFFSYFQLPVGQSPTFLSSLGTRRHPKEQVGKALQVEKEEEQTQVKVICQCPLGHTCHMRRLHSSLPQDTRRRTMPAMSVEEEQEEQ